MGSSARQIEVAFASEPMAAEVVKERLGKSYSELAVVSRDELRRNGRSEFASLYKKLRWAVCVTLGATQGADRAQSHVGLICDKLGIPPGTTCAWYDSWEHN